MSATPPASLTDAALLLWFEEQHRLVIMARAACDAAAARREPHPTWAYDLVQGELRTRRELNARSPEDWLSLLADIVPDTDIRHNAALMVWWDFFSNRLVSRRTPAFDGFLAVPAAPVRKIDLCATMHRLGYSPSVAFYRTSSRCQDQWFSDQDQRNPHRQADARRTYRQLQKLRRSVPPNNHHPERCQRDPSEGDHRANGNPSATGAKAGLANGRATDVDGRDLRCLAACHGDPGTDRRENREVSREGGGTP